MPCPFFVMELALFYVLAKGKNANRLHPALQLLGQPFFFAFCYSYKGSCLWQVVFLFHITTKAAALGEAQQLALPCSRVQLPMAAKAAAAAE